MAKFLNGRGERIRTSGLLLPKQAHYQAVLRPVTWGLDGPGQRDPTVSDRGPAYSRLCRVGQAVRARKCDAGTRGKVHG